MSKREEFYFERGGEEYCYPLEHFQERLGEDICEGVGVEIFLELAVRERKSGAMWCKNQGEIIEEGSDACGRHCQEYSPCNKVSGRCVHLGNCFEGTGEYFVLSEKGLLKIEE